MRARVYSLLALSFVGLVLTGCLPRPQGTPVRDDQGRVIARLEPNAPVVVLRRSNAGTKILLSGWIDVDISNNSLLEVENYPGLLYGHVQYRQRLGFTRVLGVLENQTDKCFDVLILEGSVWSANKDGMVEDSTTTSLKLLRPGERVSFSLDFYQWKVEELQDLILRLRYEGSIGC